MQTMHPGRIQPEGATASDAYMSELIHGRDGSSHLNYFVYHDRYQRTGERRTPGGRQRSCLS